MIDYEVTRISNGWQVESNGLLILAQSPRLDRSSIRAALSARQNGTILWTQNVNLTSDKSRNGFIKALDERGIGLDEKVLIALEDVCRRRPTEKVGGVPPSNFSATVQPFAWADMEATINSSALLQFKGFAGPIQ